MLNRKQIMKKDEKIVGDNILFWCQFSNAVSSFCLDTTLQGYHPEKMVSSLIGEELEWCGSYSFLFLATKYNDLTKRFKVLEDRCKSLENMLSTESSSTSNLRKQLKQLHSLSQDNEWQLQEQLAHTNHQLSQEKDICSDLRHKLSVYEAKLTEVEMYFHSDKGILTLQLEQELAASKLRIAELEAEKDEYELRNTKRKNSNTIKSGDDFDENSKVIVTAKPTSYLV